MRRGLAIAAVAAACAGAGTGLAGCGGGGGSLARPLSYLPAGTPAVAILATDLDDAQWHTFNGALAPLLLGTSVRRIVRETSEQAGLSFGDDVKPLLGNPLVVGVARGAGPGPPLVAALQLRDAGTLDRVLRHLRFTPAGRAGDARLYRPPTIAAGRLAPTAGGAGGATIAVDGDVVVAALSEARLRRALADRRRPGRLTEREVGRGLNGLPGHALLRVYGSLRALASAAPARLPWVRALRTYGLTLKLKRRVIEARAVVRTATREVSDAQLPLAPGGDPAPIPVREDQAVVGLRDAAPTATFLLALAGRRAAAAAALLHQLAGPAFAGVEPDGDTSARAGLRDPRTATRALRRAAPRLGWRALAGGLYRIPGARLVAGIVGGALVAAPDPSRARAAAAEPTVRLSSTRGALVARADLSVLGPALERALGIQTGSLDEAVAYVKADRGGLRAVLRVGIR